jgi:serine/threonine protein kinase
MGVVYRARQKKLNRIVALKMMTGHYGPDELIRFLAEAETAAGLHHTNIVQIHEVGDQDGAPFFSMEYIETGSLADRLRAGTIPPREAAQLLIGVARALHFAHQNGIVHRDMKPANVLLDPEGVPKVTDFGIAKRLKGDTPLTLSGAVIGTPTYMAPEQAKGTSRDVGAAADVYSLGAILYEMLAGRPPFLPDESETALMMRVITEDPVSPAWHRPDVPRDLETICLKCLEKEPRDRYASAAAFAEDLRRYLDDESILARPPTTVLRTIKWIRRHPWRFVSRAALLLVLVAGGIWFWNWEFYHRLHTEWSSGINMVNAQPQPSRRISAGEASRLGYSFKFTRQGRWGHVKHFEIMNPRGHLAALRRLLGDVMATWLEGAMGAQKDLERMRETVRYDFIYSGNDLLETIGSDRNGHPTFRAQWDRATVDEGGRRIVGTRFVDIRGFDFSTTQGASHARFIRDGAGRDLEVQFFSGSGQPAANSEEVFGYRAAYDSAGRAAQLTNLDRDGKPMANRLGIIALGYTYDQRGQTARVEYRDGAGQAQPWKGLAAVAFEYDGNGNAVLLRRSDEANKLTNGEADEWAVAHFNRNAQGELVELVYEEVSEDGSLSPYSRVVIEYDSFGYPADVRLSAEETSHHRYVNDAVGNVLEEQWLDEAGKPITGADGWSSLRRLIVAGTAAAGWKEEERYFDTAGAKAYSTSGGHHLGIMEYDQVGVVRRIINEDCDPTRFDYFRYVVEPEFTRQGFIRRLISRMEDKEGQLTGGAKGWSGMETEFDDDGRVVTEWKLGLDPSRTGAPIVRIDTEWQKTGSRKRRVQQACDTDRKPLTATATGGAARIEEEYDQLDRVERFVESGINEKIHGFNTRETKFSGGSFQSVRHGRSDGTALESVRVIITSVAPKQPKAAELKVGDQLVAANGNPVRSTYEWIFAGNFPGGWIEVLRDGQTVRIEGFEAGKIGITLEDRAP